MLQLQSWGLGTARALPGHQSRCLLRKQVDAASGFKSFDIARLGLETNLNRSAALLSVNCAGPPVTASESSVSSLLFEAFAEYPADGVE